MVLQFNNPWNGYDHWLTTDVENERAWKEVYEREWVLSLVKQENPHMSDTDAEHLAEERYYSGYYDEFDF